MTTARRGLDPVEVDRLVSGDHHDPHHLLGAHPEAGRTIVRAFHPGATAARVVHAGGELVLQLVDERGLFEGAVDLDPLSEYRLHFTSDAHSWEMDDPYRFLPTLGELDLHLIGEGSHRELWNRLGARVIEHQGVRGTAFAVWAPNARGVHLVSDASYWDTRLHPMRALGGTGVWELFLPHAAEGLKYKYAVRRADGRQVFKADPLARAMELPPGSASIVVDSHYTWADQGWMSSRDGSDGIGEAMSVYEVHLGSWRRDHGRELTYRESGRLLADYCAEMGFTHVELLPIAEHPFGGSWGYQVSSYFAPTSRFGTPDDLRWMVDHLHQRGIGVILDWVPAHFPKDEWALAQFDGTSLYEHVDPRRGEHPDWGTLVFNYGRNEVRNFLVANARYWCEEFHIDGLRVDAVASMLYLDYSRKAGEWLPNVHGGRENLEAIALLREVNDAVTANYPGAFTVAEESTAWPGVSRPTAWGGLGFRFKWNMGWMHDTLDYLSKDPVFRKYHHHQLTFGLWYAYSENFTLPLSHDEVVHGKGSLLGKMPGDRWRKLANLRAMLAWMWAHPGKKLLFMGGELAQEREWSHDRELDWFLLDNAENRGVQAMVRDANARYRATAALWERDGSADGFEWIDAGNVDQNVYSFLRFDAHDHPGIACVANFSPNVYEGFRVGLPLAGRWDELLNTDAAAYGGGGVGNLGAIQAEDRSWNGQPCSAAITVPPLAVLWFGPAAT